MKHIKKIEELNEGMGPDGEDLYLPQKYENPLHSLIKELESYLKNLDCGVNKFLFDTKKDIKKIVRKYKKY